MHQVHLRTLSQTRPNSVTHASSSYRDLTTNQAEHCHPCIKFIYGPYHQPGRTLSPMHQVHLRTLSPTRLNTVTHASSSFKDLITNQAEHCHPCIKFIYGPYHKPGRTLSPMHQVHIGTLSPTRPNTVTHASSSFKDLTTNQAEHCHPCIKFIYGPYHQPGWTLSPMHQVHIWTLSPTRPNTVTHASSSYMDLITNQAEHCHLCIKFIYGPYHQPGRTLSPMHQVHIWTLSPTRLNTVTHASSSYRDLITNQAEHCHPCIKFIYGPYHQPGRTLSSMH